MTKSLTSLNQFFVIDDLSKKQVSQLTQSRGFEAIKQKWSKKLKGVPVSKGLVEQLVRPLSDLLNVDLRAILVSAWSQSNELAKFLDPEKYPPGETQIVSLTEHTLTSTHQPVLKPYINKVALGQIKFNVLLELTLKGANLKIQDGKIMEATLGSCQGHGSVKYEDYALIEKELQELTLPGTIKLGDGIPLKHPLKDVHQFVSNLKEASF